MCTNCLSTAEAAVAQAALVGAALRAPVQRALARRGLVRAPDPVGRDARTVHFLRTLDLDPVVILGAEAVRAAEGWAPAPQPAGSLAGWSRRRRLAASARPIGSHSLITAQ